MKYCDYLIVGSGLFGATFAYRAITKNKHFAPLGFFPLPIFLYLK